MTAQNAVDNRPTENVIIVTFRNWTEFILYDSRETPYDVPFPLSRCLVESVHFTDGLTIVEI